MLLGTPRALRNSPAGLASAISPAGEIWSVVTESPTYIRHLAPLIGLIAAGFSAIPSKNGGFWMYVLLASHLNSSLLLTGTLFHVGLPVNTLAYWLRNCSGVTHVALRACTSACVGQMSLRKTFFPLLSIPMGSLIGSQSTVPAIAYATTSGGLAR